MEIQTAEQRYLACAQHLLDSSFPEAEYAHELKSAMRQLPLRSEDQLTGNELLEWVTIAHRVDQVISKFINQIEQMNHDEVVDPTRELTAISKQLDTKQALYYPQKFTDLVQTIYECQWLITTLSDLSKSANTLSSDYKLITPGYLDSLSVLEISSRKILNAEKNSTLAKLRLQECQMLSHIQQTAYSIITNIAYHVCQALNGHLPLETIHIKTVIDSSLRAIAVDHENSREAHVFKATLTNFNIRSLTIQLGNEKFLAYLPVIFEPEWPDSGIEA